MCADGEYQLNERTDRFGPDEPESSSLLFELENLIGLEYAKMFQSTKYALFPYLEKQLQDPEWEIKHIPDFSSWK